MEEAIHLLTAIDQLPTDGQERCPEFGRKCWFTGTKEEVEAHLETIAEMRKLLANGIDLFTTDRRK